MQTLRITGGETLLPQGVVHDADLLLADGCIQGACACGAGPACGAGQRCLGGSCICDGQSCAAGCCAADRSRPTRCDGVTTSLLMAQSGPGPAAPDLIQATINS